MDHEDIHYEERRDILDAAVEGSIRRAVVCINFHAVQFTYLLLVA